MSFVLIRWRWRCAAALHGFTSGLSGSEASAAMARPAEVLGRTAWLQGDCRSALLDFFWTVASQAAALYRLRRAKAAKGIPAGVPTRTSQSGTVGANPNFSKCQEGRKASQEIAQAIKRIIDDHKPERFPDVEIEGVAFKKAGGKERWNKFYVKKAAEIKENWSKDDLERLLDVGLRKRQQFSINPTRIDEEGFGNSCQHSISSRFQASKNLANVVPCFIQRAALFIALGSSSLEDDLGDKW